jgi:hypothetical protein
MATSSDDIHRMEDSCRRRGLFGVTRRPLTHRRVGQRRRRLVCGGAMGLLAFTAGPLLAAGTSHAATLRPATTPSTVRVIRGLTSVTVTPGVTEALLFHGILPLPVPPTHFGFIAGWNGLTVRYGFPITGGSLDLANLTGTIDHSGGVDFVSLVNFAHLEVGHFTIHLGSSPTITGSVNGTSTVVPVFTLNLANAHVALSDHDHEVVVSGVQADLTAAAAGALDATLHTSVFTAGLDFGTATVVARIS